MRSCYSHRHGFHATGINTILADAAVAKTTLYRHFSSKEDLIIAALQTRSADFCDWLMHSVASSVHKAEDKVYLLFDLHRQWAMQPDFNGCVFVKASMAYPSPRSPVHTIAASHKQVMLKYIETLVTGCIDKDVGLVSHQIMLLLEGATASAQMHKDADAFVTAKQAVQRLLKTLGRDDYLSGCGPEQRPSSCEA